MLLSRKLLNRYVDISDISSEELADKLTAASFEVEGISTIITGTNLVVGHVLECEAHPDSDHLNITKVDLGTSVEQIVCGAENIAKGQYVVVATNGAVLKDMTIKPTQVRGVESNGMICSLNELGVAEKFQTEEQKSGIVVLEGSPQPGSSAAAALGLEDEILDISQTANRSDFLSIFSIAYEVSAIFNRPVTIPNYANAADIGGPTELKVATQTPRGSAFLGKVVNHVEIGQSPLWMREVLIASNIKPINNLVDISNFVMLETGQPLHFYDKAFLSNLSLSIEDGFEGKVLGLDDVEYDITKNDALIMNGETPVGIAGIIGLGNSMIQDDTNAIVIEVARFDHVSIRQSANRLGLSTEASVRFSKPMDNLSSIKAMDRAVMLLQELANASDFEETVSVGEVVRELPKVSVSVSKINAYLGTHIEKDLIIDVFQRLYFEPSVDGDIIECTIPSYRKDIFIEEDLIEEVIRIIGFDVLEESLPLMDLTMGDLNPFQKSIRLIEDTLLGQGLDQINSYTLVSKELTQGLNALKNPIALALPMSDKRTHLRTHMFPSLLEVASYNSAHKNKDFLFFEHSSLYTNDLTTNRLAIIGTGQLVEENWTGAKINVDFFTVKGIFLNLMDKLGYTENRFEFSNKNLEDSYLHPYKSAQILINRKAIGYIGHVHPTVADDNDLKDAVYLEIDLDLLLGLKAGKVKAAPISKYPSIERDLAVLVDMDVSAASLRASIEKAARRYLTSIEVFDVFTGEKLNGKKSIAFELVFNNDNNLDLKAISDIMESITKELESKHQAEIR
ncbi:MAG TPA: phenylalanine--tRNA ligase subunit beta [Erysipelothrix sp.]|nr:phenylalanine--tRNA ligase subunit beta [Erysipelothrix sp.]